MRPLGRVFRSVSRLAACAVARLRTRNERAAAQGRRRMVGWVTAGTLAGRGHGCLGCLDGAVGMRVRNNGEFLNREDSRYFNEIYRRGEPYDIVVFFKAMDEACLREVALLQARGTRVIFDANVNYYDVWGDYDIADTKPTSKQQREAIDITRAVDHVVADSSYIATMARRHNANVTWIPDNVNTRMFHPPGSIVPRPRIRLVWSGVARKADHLLQASDALAECENAELVLVSDERPAVCDQLPPGLRVRFHEYTDAGYAKVLRDCDVIISPKRLSNAYEMGHTEYKITLGMAAGLPAIASPQQSYVEAIDYAGGGRIARDKAEWRAALAELIGQPELRREIGVRALRTVRERYATNVTAAAFGDLFDMVLARGASR